MRNLTEEEKNTLIKNQKEAEGEFERKFPDKEKSPILYYLPEEYLAYLMEKNGGIPPKINRDYPWIDDLLPLTTDDYNHEYIIVINGEKFFYHLPFKQRP